MVVLAWVLCASPAAAGNLDIGLHKVAPDLLAFVKEKGWKNVGVLPFQVQRGARPLSYSGGPLSHNLTTRLENALIMAMSDSEQSAVGIIRDAASTASKAGVGAYSRSAPAFQKLFDTSYDLAWGNRKVEADAFLTGQVFNTGDRTTTRVVFLAIDRQSRQNNKFIPLAVLKPTTEKPRRPLELTVTTDRMLAADLGYGFSLNRALTLKRGRAALQRRDQDVRVEIQNEDDNGQQFLDQGQGQGIGMEHGPANIAGFRFELHYNGINQPIKPVVGSQKGSLAAEFQAPPATAGTPIAMYLTRLSTEQRKFGVVLMVNGKSTWQMQDMEPIQCRKWVYDAGRAGERDSFEGFYTGTTGNNLHRFRALTAEESLVKASELGSRAGWIDVYVFASGDGKGSGDEEQMLISTRGSVRSRGLGLKTLQEQLRKTNNVRKSARVKPKDVGGGLIVHENEAVPSPEIREGGMPNPVLVGHMAIRYYEGAGQLGKTVEQPFAQPPRPQQPQPGGVQPIEP